jgi:NAD-dependent DNA ligase (contains BRCT domain type II)
LFQVFQKIRIILLSGEKPTNSKIDKANSLEVKIINENEMFKLLQ